MLKIVMTIIVLSNGAIDSSLRFESMTLCEAHRAKIMSAAPQAIVVCSEARHGHD